MTQDSSDTPTRTLTAVDPATGERRTTLVAAEFEFDGRTYYLLAPEKDAVWIIRISGEGDDEVMDALEPADFESIAEAINGALARWDIEVVVSDDGLVLSGDIPDELLETGPELEIETGDGDERALLVLVEIEVDGDRHLVATEAGHMLHPAVRDGDHARMLTEDEVEAMRDVLDRVYAAMGGGDEGPG